MCNVQTHGGLTTYTKMG